MRHTHTHRGRKCGRAAPLSVCAVFAGREARSCEEGIALAFIVAVECKSFVLAGHTVQVPLLSVGLNPGSQLHR